MNKIWIFVGALIVLAAAVFLLPVTEYLEAFLTWVQANPSTAWIIYILVYVAATVLLLPGSILTLGAGYLFGVGAGYAVVAVASVTGASLAFLIGRFFARDWVAGKLSDMPRFAALDRAIEEKGALVVLLTRLSPIFPFNLLNYALGLTGVSLPTFAVVSWVGMIPGTLLYVYLGSVASNLTALVSGDVDAGNLGGWLFYAGLAATLVLTVVITRIATRALNTELEQGA